MKTDNENNTLENEVRSAVEQGHDVQEMVRLLTLRKISARSLDIESLRQIATSVLRGARAGVQKELNLSAAQTETARTQLKQVVNGLDMALAQLASASQLALEEASSRAQRYSSEELTRTRSDLESLEKLLADTLQNSANDAKDAVSDILHDLAAHSRTHGSVLAAQIQEALSVIRHQLSAAGQAQARSSLHLAQATSDLLRQIAAGVLSGLSDHIKPAAPKDKDD